MEIERTPIFPERFLREVAKLSLRNEGKPVDKHAYVLEVSELKTDGSGFQLEPYNPQGNKFCFTHQNVTICAKTHKQLDLAESMIMKYESSIESYKVIEGEKKEKLKERSKTGNPPFTPLGDLPYILEATKKKTAKKKETKK